MRSYWIVLLLVFCLSPSPPVAAQTCATGDPDCRPEAAASTAVIGEASGAHRVDSGLPTGAADATGSVKTALEKLNVSPSEMMTLQRQWSAGSLSKTDLETVCAKAGASGMTAGEVVSIGQALGLSAAQVDALTECVNHAKPEPSQVSNGPEGAARVAALPAEAPESHQRSNIEREFGQIDNYTTPDDPGPQRLTQFGYSIFSSGVSTFAPVTNVPVGDDYSIGPGDELNVIYWGRVNQTLSLTVQRDGTVLLPNQGPITVAGLTFSEARNLIESRGGQITGTQVRATMGRLRTIQVFVVGEVSQPGAYTISALSRISNALVAAGGISKIGSLRHIELRRRSQLIRLVDLYDTLLKGDNSGDERIDANDVVFVGPIGPVVGIVGDIKRPGIYELKTPTENLGSVLRLGLGVSAFSYSQRLQIKRVENHRSVVALEVDATQTASWRFPVRDGDLIKIYHVLPRPLNSVALKGNVRRQGEYAWFQGMRVSDLVKLGEGLGRNTFLKYASIRRIEQPDERVRLVPIDLGAALSGDFAANISLRPRDELSIYNENEMSQQPIAEVVGEIRRPGRYPITPGMRVSDLIYTAGGLNDDAYQQKAELVRTLIANGSTAQHLRIDLDLRKALTGDVANDPPIERDDRLLVTQASRFHPAWTVLVSGRVTRPGPYAVAEGERLSSVLTRCGGFLPDAFPEGIVLARSSLKEIQQQRIDESRERLGRELGRYQLMAAQVLSSGGDGNGASQQAMAGLERIVLLSQTQRADGRLVIKFRGRPQDVDSYNDVVLLDRDQVAVPQVPEFVNVMGEVYHPASLVFIPGKTANDYIYRCGGSTRNADLKELMIIKADGSVLTADGLQAERTARFFPLLTMLSGGILDTRLERGDTVFIPEDVRSLFKLGYAKDITTIVSQSASALAVIALLGSRL